MKVDIEHTANIEKLLQLAKGFLFNFTKSLLLLDFTSTQKITIEWGTSERDIRGQNLRP